MNSKTLTWNFYGEDYDQVLTLERNGACLFKAFAYNFDDSAAGGIVLRLNFGKDRKYPHLLRRFGDKFLLVPCFTNLSPEYHSLASTTGRILDYAHLVKLWESLRYNVEELNEVTAVTKKEIIACWLLNSHVAKHYLEDWSGYLRKVESNILAVDPNGFDAMKVFSCVTRGNLDTTPYNSGLGIDVTMYVDQGQSVFDWLSVRAESNRVSLIIGDETQILVEDPIT